MRASKAMQFDCPLAEAAKRWPHQTAFVAGEDRWTYREWDERAAEVAASVRSSGWQPSDRMGLLAQPEPLFLGNFFGCLRAGVTVILISPRWPPALVETAAEETCWNGFWRVGANPPNAAHQSATSRVSTGAMATVIFSSGSTGGPKAIAHSLNAHIASAKGANDNLPLDPHHAWFLSLSPAHVGGLGILFRCVLAGAAILLPRAGAAFEEMLRDAKPSHLSLVPTQLKRLLDHNEIPWPGLQGILLGGAPIPRSLIERCHSTKWPILTTYGLSEMASQVTASRPSADLDELLTAGRLLNGRQLRISADGEIWVRGETLFAGWIRQGELVDATNEEGWYPTRDLGSIDPSGRLMVRGRIDNQFISGGENIHPEAIERSLLDLPTIFQAIIIPVDHAEYGQRPVAFVAATEWDEANWQAHLESKWPRFMLPDRYFRLPANAADKPSRSQLRELARRLITD